MLVNRNPFIDKSYSLQYLSPLSAVCSAQRERYIIIAHKSITRAPAESVKSCRRLTLEINASSWEISCQGKHNHFRNGSFTQAALTQWDQMTSKLATFHSQMWFYTVNGHCSICDFFSPFFALKRCFQPEPSAFGINLRNSGICRNQCSLWVACSTLQQSYIVIEAATCQKEKKSNIRLDSHRIC